MTIAKTKTRILSDLFDLLLCGGISLLIMIPSILAFINVLIDENSINTIALFVSSFCCGAVVIIFALCYFIVFPSFLGGQTLGKRFFRIRILKDDGTSVDFKLLFVRELVRLLVLITSLGVSAIVNTIAISSSKKHLAFHDVISSTRVVNEID